MHDEYGLAAFIVVMLGFMRLMYVRMKNFPDQRKSDL